MSTAATVQAPVRQFRVGSMNLPDPDPTMSAEEVVALYAHNYPSLRFATIESPRMEGDTLVIEAKLPTVQTKG